MCKALSHSGFSLVELLITLALVGVVATFTIPPLLNAPGSSANSRYTAIAKDTEFMVLGAYEAYRASHPSVSLFTQFKDLAPYLNYVNVDTSNSTQLNHPPQGAFLTNGANCGTQFIGTNWCYHLHNGAVIWYNDAWYFGGTSTTNAIWFNIDPDGSGSAQSLQVFLTYNGFLYTVGTLPTTMTMGYLFSTFPQAPVAQDASWFTGN